MISSLSIHRQKIDLVDKKILADLIKIHNCKYDSSYSSFNNSVFLDKLVKKLAKGKKDINKKILKNLEKNIKIRLTIVKKVKILKDKEFKDISKSKRYYDKNREKEIIEKVKTFCKKKKVDSKVFISCFKEILKFCKKEFKY